MVKKISFKDKFHAKSFLFALFSFNIIFFFQRKFFYFRDYSIIWDGAHRLTEGFIPYINFGIPVGPISLYLPALFFKFFGASWLTLQISQLFINLLLISIVWGILSLISSKKFELYLGLLFFNINYIILLTHPV